MSGLLPAGRKLQVGVYFARHGTLGEPSVRYDYDLVSLVLNLPWLGGTTVYAMQTPSVACTESNYLTDKYCALREAFGDTLPPIGSLLAAEGRLTLLRVHDVGTGFGPPTDFIDVEVVIALDGQPGKAFGFQLRTDANRDAHRDMLNLLRDAFKRERRVRIDYVRTGVRNGRIIRVVQIP